MDDKYRGIGYTFCEHLLFPSSNALEVQQDLSGGGTCNELDFAIPKSKIILIPKQLLLCLNNA